MQKTLRNLLMGCVLFGMGGHVAALEIVTIEPRFAIAADLVPVLQPFLAKPGGVSAFGQRLIIRGTAEEIETIRALLPTLDQRPTNLIISVRHGESIAIERDDDRARVRIGANLGERPRITGRADVRIERYRSRSAPQHHQQVRVLNGQVATLRTGTTRPLTLTHLSPYGHVESHVAFIEASDRLFVKPQLRGDRVQLNIAPRLAAFGQEDTYSVRTQETVTTIDVALGEWVEIASSGGVRNSQQRGITYRTRERRESDYRVLVMVRRAGRLAGPSR
ncbi:MAG: secretin N-terminal domain-containing protein [Pseudomonadota bacterium]